MNKCTSALTWEWRLATSRDDGTGFFTVVGGYDVIVRERMTGRPVTGATIIAGSESELQTRVAAMLTRFESQWLAQTANERERNMKIAAMTASRNGWGSP